MSAKLNILLISLPREGEVDLFLTPDYFLNDFMRYPPLGLLAIAAGVKPSHRVDVLDAAVRDMTIDETVAAVIEARPDILGISVLTWRLYAAHRICEKVKDLLPKTIIILGGPHINYHASQEIRRPSVDYVMSGFCEKTFPRWIDVMAGGELSRLREVPGLHYKENGVIRSNPPAEVPAVLDGFPFPDRKLIDLDEYYTLADRSRMATMYSSRGCPYRCIFCDVAEKKFHYRTADSIVDEFQELIALGIEEIHIFDDTFNVIRERVIRMCREISRRNIKVRWSSRTRVNPCDRDMLALMKEAGCVRLHVGVESLEPEVLTAIKKKQDLRQIQDFFRWCNELAIETVAFFILGFPGETEEYRKNFYRKVRELNPSYLYVNILQPLYRTEYYNRLLEQGVWDGNPWEEFVLRPVPAFKLPPFRDPLIESELVRLVDNIHRKFYLSPRFIINDLRRDFSFRMLVRKAKAAMKLLFA